MLDVRTAGQHYHDATRHSYRSVLADPNYVDPRTQPIPDKVYPQFYRRFPLEAGNPIHDLIRLTSTITYRKDYQDGPYQLRVIPSAGALYPTELYVQCRGIKGMIDGIYHVEVASHALTLLYELIDDGLEAYLSPQQTVKGLIFLVSCVYYRSSWKYKQRSLRYCFLDAGHHLGAIEASAYLHQRPLEIWFDFDKTRLNADLGFENKEFVTAAVVVGEAKARPVRPLRSPLPFVAGTDYFEADPFVEAGYRDTLQPASPAQPLTQPQFGLHPERFLQAILDRRSARRFRKRPISGEDFFSLRQALGQPIPSAQGEPITPYWVVHRVNGLEPGLYRELNGSTELTPLKLGDWSEKTGYLCINQAIARDGAVVCWFTIRHQNYQTAAQLAGLLGHRLYLMSHYLGLGCSGIGAYYDDEARVFLETEKDVLYAVAIGI